MKTKTAEKKITITIDGVSGAGKGTTAQGVAEKLGYAHIDSGAMYRVCTLFLSQKNILPDDDEKILKNLPKLQIDFNTKSEVLMNNQNVENKIRTEEIDSIVYKYAQNPIIRKFVNDRQRELLQGGGFVIDGRDMGSVVFPEAELKIYIDCDVEVRAKRRALQYGVENKTTEVEKIKNEFIHRDQEDKTRKHSPLIIPKNAIIIDTTKLTIEEQIEQVYILALELLK